MRVITINVPEEYLTAMKKLVGRMYPSRSELIRVAIREFLIREVEFVNNLPKTPLKPPKPARDEIEVLYKIGRPPLEHKSQFQTDFEVIETPLETIKYIEEIL